MARTYAATFRVSVSAAIAVVLAGAVPALASNGLALVGQSAKAAGRGGASVAVPGDAISQAHNPALLTDLPRLRLDGSFIWFGERTRERDFTGNDETDFSSAAFVLPVFGVSWDPFGEEISLDGAVISAGSDLRIGFGLFQPITGVFAPTATVAVRVTDRLSVGASINFLVTYVTLETDGSTAGGGDGQEDFTANGIVRIHREPDGTPVDPPEPLIVDGEQVSWGEIIDIANEAPPGTLDAADGEGEVEVKIKDLFGFGISGQVGVTWRPIDDLVLGATVRSPGIVFGLEGQAEIDVTDLINEVSNDEIVGEILDAIIDTFLPDAGQKGFKAEYDIEVDSLRLPASLAFGAAYWPFPWWLVTVDLAWIGWDQAFNEINITASNGTNRDFNEIMGGDEIEYTFRLDWEDQFIIAIGTSVAVTDWLVLRAGFNRGTNPVPKDTQTANSFVVENHVTGGFGIYFSGWELDAAYIYGLPTEKQLDTKAFKVEQHSIYASLGYQF